MGKHGAHSGMVGKLQQLVPSPAFELLGMLKSWQGHICHQCDPSWSCRMGPGTSSTRCHCSWKWPNRRHDGECGSAGHAGQCRWKFSSLGSLSNCNYI